MVILLESLNEFQVKLEQKLKREVFTNYDILLNQASKVEALDDNSQIIFKTVESLYKTQEEVKKDIENSYKKISQLYKKIQRLHNASELLRTVRRLLILINSKKLEEGVDDVRKAQCIHEIEKLPLDKVTTIEVINPIIIAVNAEKEKILKAATDQLLNGVRNYEKGDITKALTILVNFKKVEGIVVDIEEKFKISFLKKVKKRISSELKVDDFWKHLNKLVETLNESIKKLNFIEDALNNKVILFNREDSKKNYSDKTYFLAENFQKYGCQTLFASLDDLIKTSNLKKEIETDYPKLAQTLGSFLMQISFPNAFEKSFLSLFNDRLLVNVNNITSGVAQQKSLSTINDNVTELLHTSLRALRHSKKVPDLFKGIVDSITISFDSLLKKLKTFTPERKEAYAAIDTSPSSLQIRVIAVANIYFKALRVFYFFAKEAEFPCYKSSFTSMLTNIKQAVTHILTHLFEATLAYMKSLILKMHKEDYDAPIAGESEYIINLKAFVENYEAKFLSRFEPPELLLSWRKKLVVACCEFFILTICLLPSDSRPESNVIGDISLFERVMNIMLAPVSRRVHHVYLAHGLLIGVKNLFSSELELLDNSRLSKTLGAVNVAHYILSRAPEKYTAPHVHLGWSLLKYIEWAASHSEKEVIAVIKDSLKASTNEKCSPVLAKITNL